MKSSANLAASPATGQAPPLLGVDNRSAQHEELGTASCDNVMLESSGGSFMIIKLERLGAGKLIYGSEFPMQHPQVELEKIRMAASGNDFEKITSRNLLALFEKRRIPAPAEAS